MGDPVLKSRNGTVGGPEFDEPKKNALPNDRALICRL
jgi:hypothetical protein